MLNQSPRPEFGDVSLWGTLQRALGHLHDAAFEVQRGDREAALMWLEDARRALGEVALELAERHDTTREGYARLAEHILTPPSLGCRGGVHRAGGAR